MLASLLCGWLFVRHSHRTAEPIIPFNLLRSRGFGTLNVINYIYGGCALGIGALIPLYAEERYNFTSLQAGSVLSTRALGVLLIASTTAFLIRRVGYRRPMIAGFTVASIGMILLGDLPAWPQHVRLAGSRRGNDGDRQRHGRPVDEQRHPPSRTRSRRVRSRASWDVPSVRRNLGRSR